MQPRHPRGSPRGGQFAPGAHAEANVPLSSSPGELPVEPDVLDILRSIAPSEIGKHFYLAGGTALALQLRHRRSNDLDYFTDADHLDRPSIWRWLRRANLGKYDVVLSEAGQVDLVVGKRRRKVSFIAYPFPSQRAHVEVEGQLCADIVDVAAMKAYTLGRRGAARDYVDIEAVVTKGHVPLDEIIAVAKCRFVLDGEPVFSERLFLQQLVYTADLDDIGSLEALTTNFADVERSLRRIVADYVKRELS
jgi:hypothetical protein